MKTLTLILTFFLISFYAIAQSISSYGLSVASNCGTGDGKRMYYVVGQLSYLSLATKKTSTTKVDTSKSSLTTTYSVKTYPNPTKDVVCIQFSQEVKPSFKIFDSLGNDLSNVVSTSSSSTLYQLNLKNLSIGEYIIKITSASQPTSSVKIIKQN